MRFSQRLALILCVACALGGPLNAQRQVGVSKVSLDLGTYTVWLGMPETDALSGFQRAGYKVIGKPSDPAWPLRFVVSDRSTYSVAFRDGKLIFADRAWASSASDELGTVISALASLASHDAHSCTIIYAPLNNPDNSAERVFIDCGERSVLLAKSKISGFGNAMTITERIGRLY